MHLQKDGQYLKTDINLTQMCKELRVISLNKKTWNFVFFIKDSENEEAFVFNVF